LVTWFVARLEGLLPVRLRSRQTSCVGLVKTNEYSWLQTVDGAVKFLDPASLHAVVVEGEVQLALGETVRVTYPQFEARTTVWHELQFKVQWIPPEFNDTALNYPRDKTLLDRTMSIRILCPLFLPEYEEVRQGHNVLHPSFAASPRSLLFAKTTTTVIHVAVDRPVSG
jgi:hypothetical protein